MHNTLSLRRIYLLAILTTLIILAGGTTFATRPQPALAQSGATMRLEPADFTLAAGEEKELTVVVENVQNFGAFQFDLVFPPDRLSLSGITLGPFLGDSGRTAMPLGPVREPGRISFGGFTLGDAAGVDGGGAVAVLTLRGEVPGGGELRLEEVQVLDIKSGDLGPTVTGGTLTVTGDAPAPTITPGAPTLTPLSQGLRQLEDQPSQNSNTGGATGQSWMTPVLVVLGLFFLGLAGWQLAASRRPPA